MKEMENIEMSKDIIVIYNSQTGFTKKYAPVPAASGPFFSDVHSSQIEHF